MRYGRERYAQNNALLNARFERHSTLIAAHRGSWVGNIIQNTVGAYRAALMMGADIVECDATMTTDGVVYAFHDNAEPRVFGIRENLRTLTSAQVDAMAPRNALERETTRHINRLSEVLQAYDDGTLINLDRSWFWFDAVLDVLDRYPHAARQVIIKAPMKAANVTARLAAHPVKYMFMPICYTMRDIADAIAIDGLNLVGAELIAFTPQDELFGEAPSRLLHENGLFAWVNALVIGDAHDKPLYGGVDDDISVLRDPALGWGRLMDMGIDVIQTDWPAILRDYRGTREKG